MMRTGESYILRSGCAVAEFCGTSYRNASEILKLYVESRNKKCNKEIGTTSAHTFVVMSLIQEVKLCEYFRRHKLGSAIKTQFEQNINHTGWHKKVKNTGVQVIVLTPDHEALSKWYQDNFDKDYELNNGFHKPKPR